jgi:hypothetical protein
MVAWLPSACKYLDHLPFYRIEQIASRQGVPLARSTLAEWIGRIGAALQPLAELYTWLLATQRAVAAGSGTAKAVHHALKRWRASTLYRWGGWPLTIYTVFLYSITLQISRMRKRRSVLMQDRCQVTFREAKARSLL